jgi:hypothetical protein
MFATLLSAIERVCHDTANTERGVDADLGSHLVGSADPDRSTGSGVGALGALTDNHEIDLGVAPQWALHARIEPPGPQVDVVVQREAQPQQQTTFEHATGH